MAYKLVIVDGKRWQKDCNILEKKQMLRILEAVRTLEHEPWDEHVHVKQLQNYELADYRLRVGNYRVLFNRDELTKTVLLLRVLHRSKLY